LIIEEPQTPLSSDVVAILVKMESLRELHVKCYDCEHDEIKRAITQNKNLQSLTVVAEYSYENISEMYSAASHIPYVEFR
jgi:hypothetical protein